MQHKRVVILKPARVEGSPCGDHQEAFPPAGRQERSLVLEIDPASNMSSIILVVLLHLSFKNEGIPHLEIFTPKMKRLAIRNLCRTETVPEATDKDANQQEATNKGAKNQPSNVY